MNLVSRKLIIIIAIAVALLIVLMQAQRVNITPAVNDSPIRIAVSQTPLSSPFIIADQQQFFVEHGVSVEIVPCYGGVACAKMLFDGDVDLATASESVVVFQSFNRNDFKLIASFVESGNDLKLLTLNEYNIEHISALSGKSVGVIKASASEYYLDSLLIAHNLTQMPLNKIYLKPQELEQSLISNAVDAISVWEPYGYLLETRANSETINLGMQGVYNLSFNLLAMNEDLNKTTEESARILRAVGEAIDWIHANPDEARVTIASRLDIPLEQLEWSWKDYVFRLSLSNSLLSNLQMQARWAMSAGLVEGVQPEYRQILFPQSLEHALNVEALLK